MLGNTEESLKVSEEYEELRRRAQLRHAILRDPRVNPMAARLYQFLLDGEGLEVAATTLKRNPEWLRRYEKQLRDLGYIEIHDVYVKKLDGRPGRVRQYVFLTPDQIAS